MKKRTFRWGWLIAVGAMTALACTCGALGQAQQAVQTAQALQTQAEQFSTQAQGLATEFEESGFAETAQAIGTDSGDDSDVPEDVPVFPQNENMFAFEGTVTFTTSASLQEVADYYKQEMPNNGWSEAETSVETADSVVLVFSKDGRTANVTINGLGDQAQVLITTEGN